MTDRTTAVQFGLPAGIKGVHVAVGGFATYVLATDNNIYSAGLCDSGMLGYGYTITGCVNQSTYKRVTLPTPTSDPNTIPTTNITNDNLSTYVRMQGGKVYGWGDNGHSQFGNGTATSSSTPAQIGTFGNTGQPKATQVTTDGISVWILDDTGSVWSAGDNTYGEVGSAAPVKIDSAGKCLDNKTQDGVTIQISTCNGTVAQAWAWRSDGTIYNPNKDRCLNILSGDHDMNIAACNGSTRQKWIFRDDRTIYNPVTGKCLNNSGSDGVTVIVFTCTTTTNELFTLPALNKLTKVALPASAGNATKISTDQWFTSILTDTGQVWSMGRNEEGQLGNGLTNLYQPAPVQFILPAGVTATDVTTTAYYGTYTNMGSTHVIGSDGRVYGAGNNDYGQLGDGTMNSSSTPVVMSVIDGASIKAKNVKSGLGTTVILTYDKRLYTVGNNDYGQLGDGTTTPSLIPKANPYTNILPLAIF
jgi:alpha-tubulin suppressor-like RCC1 family protein